MCRKWSRASGEPGEPDRGGRSHDQSRHRGSDPNPGGAARPHAARGRRRDGGADVGGRHLRPGRGVPHRPPDEGGDRRGADRPRGGHAAQGRAGADADGRRHGARRHGPRDAHRHRRHGRRRVGHVQRLDGDRVRRGWRGTQGGQARESVGLEPLRVGGRGRDPRREPRSQPGQGRAVHRPGRHRVPLRAAPPHGDEARDAGAPGDGHPHGVQHPRPPDQPRGRQRAGDRRLQPRARRAPGARPRRARDDPRLRGARRRRPGRDLDDRRQLGRRGPRGRRPGEHDPPGGLRGAARDDRRPPGRGPGGKRGHHPAHPRRRARARGATSSW